MIARYGLVWAALLMALAVVLGAFGAHALASIVDAKALANWQTAVHYHLIHALALLVVSFSMKQRMACCTVWIAWGFILGIVFFSGSLYAYVLTAWHPLVWLTPIGGSIWLATWLGFAWLAWKESRAYQS